MWWCFICMISFYLRNHPIRSLLLFSSFLQVSKPTHTYWVGCFLVFHPGGPTASYSLVNLSSSSTLCSFLHKAASKTKYMLNSKLQPVIKDFLLGNHFSLITYRPCSMEHMWWEKKNHFNKMKNPRCSQYWVINSHPIWEFTKDLSQICREEVNISDQSWKKQKMGKIYTLL